MQVHPGLWGRGVCQLLAPSSGKAMNPTPRAASSPTADWLAASGVTDPLWACPLGPLKGPLSPRKDLLRQESRGGCY